MPSLRDIVYGLYGAWRLAWLDRGGLVYFDRTPAGFWKSFFAAALIAPAYILLLLLDQSEVQVESGAVRIFIIQASAYVLGWAVYPVVTHQICQVIGREKAYIGFIVAFNWCQVIQVGVYLPAVLLGALGIVPEGMQAWLYVFVYAVVLAYEWFVVRVSLEVSPFAAAGFVALDLILSILITGIADGLVR
jgi:hypothetical protein